MSLIARTCRQQLQIARSYPAAMLVVLAIFLFVLHIGHDVHRTRQAVGYIAAVCLGTFITDLIVNLYPSDAIGYPIKHSVWKELGIILGCTSLSAVFLYLRFSTIWATHDGPPRFAIALLLPFHLPIVLALIYLFYLRYKPSELGINLRYWYLPLGIHFIFGSITLLVAPDKSLWQSSIKELGITSVLIAGFFRAALPEEFSRMLLQTRLGKALHNQPFGLITATMIWSAMHSPQLIQEQHAKFLHVTIGFMPIGLLWGYITHRTKSLIPSVIVHGLNWWGLQNL